MTPRVNVRRLPQRACHANAPISGTCAVTMHMRVVNGGNYDKLFFSGPGWNFVVRV